MSAGYGITSPMVPPHYLDMLDIVIAKHGHSLSEQGVRDAVTDEGWAAYGDWGNRIVSGYGCAAFEARTGNPF